MSHPDDAGNKPKPKPRPCGHCDHGQGYLFTPMPAEQMSTQLAALARTTAPPAVSGTVPGKHLSHETAALRR